MPRKARSIEPPIYLVTPLATPERAAEDDIIRRALDILLSRARTGDILSTPTAARDLCRLRFGGLDHEEFGVVFLDAQHRVLEVESMFRGTLTQTSVYPREVVKRSLELNAGAVILTHNHPSGSTEPSRADEFLTQTIKAALALVDVRVLDHIVVSVEGATSMAERGLI